MPPLDQQTIDRITKRGVAQIIPEDEFIRRLQEGKPLRLKMGFDPSRPDLHLGHVVGLRKLRQLQDLGHELILIVGDWTAQIGDPSGQSDTRSMLSAEDVRENAETYMRQFFKVVDPDKTRAVYQSEWFGKFTLTDVIRLTAHFTVNQFLHRDDFSQRYAAQRPIAVTEMLYPLLQAYDSVAIEADVEFGGTDQLFNLLVGRELQEKVGQRPQLVFTMPILPGTDGVRRMGKSLGNYIAIDESAEDMFGKIMSLPDNVIPLYYELLTDAPQEEIDAIDQAEGPRQMEIKRRLARELATFFYSPEEAAEADAIFESTYQRHRRPTSGHVPRMPVPPRPVRRIVLTSSKPGVLKIEGDLAMVEITRLLVTEKMVESRSRATRLLRSGAIRIDDTPIRDWTVPIRSGSELRVGRHEIRRVHVRP